MTTAFQVDIKFPIKRNSGYPINNRFRLESQNSTSGFGNSGKCFFRKHKCTMNSKTDKVFVFYRDK
jgi:hypothetical protein